MAPSKSLLTISSCSSLMIVSNTGNFSGSYMSGICIFSISTFTGKYLRSPEKSPKNVASFVVAIKMQVRFTSLENLSYGSLTVLVLAEIKSFASSALFAFLSATNSSSSTTTFPTKLLTASLPLMLLSEQYHSGNSASFSIKDVFPTPWEPVKTISSSNLHPGWNTRFTIPTKICFIIQEFSSFSSDPRYFESNFEICSLPS